MIITKPNMRCSAHARDNRANKVPCSICGIMPNVLWHVTVDRTESHVCDACFAGIAAKETRPSLDYAVDAHRGKEAGAKERVVYLA